jgi:hypothetical protein
VRTFASQNCGGEVFRLHCRGSGDNRLVGHMLALLPPEKEDKAPALAPDSAPNAAVDAWLDVAWLDVACLAGSQSSRNGGLFCLFKKSCGILAGEGFLWNFPSGAVTIEGLRAGDQSSEVLAAHEVPDRELHGAELHDAIRQCDVEPGRSSGCRAAPRPRVRGDMPRGEASGQTTSFDSSWVASPRRAVSFQGQSIPECLAECFEERFDAVRLGPASRCGSGQIVVKPSGLALSADHSIGRLTQVFV